MRVLCINEDGWIEKKRFLFFWHRCRDGKGPGYGDECTVIESFVTDGETFYILSGWGHDEGFGESGFVPLTGEIEDEIEESIFLPDIIHEKIQL
jgi:hypothetical protein